MKILFTLFSLLVAGSVLGKEHCPINTMRVWTQNVGYSCVKKFNPLEQDPFCDYSSPLGNHLLQSFPGPLLPQENSPWWAQQGQFYYPNVRLPGPWALNRIEAKYFPGEGEVFAAKPNVYIDSIYDSKKFSFQFLSSPHFLATTPLLDKTLKWTGKITEKDRFEVEEVFYDYLFYDVRLPKAKMQFTNGLCSTREGVIEWMLKDLQAMKFSAIALQDFEEHWRVKIPELPFYCLYPQYNRELDSLIPIEIEMEHTTFIRSLYVLIPHQKAPDIEEEQVTPLPSRDPSEFRPGAKIRRENMFREWGVAFLGE